MIIDKLDEFIDEIENSGIYSKPYEIGEKIGRQNKEQTEIADFAEENSEGWGENETSDMIDLKMKGIIKRISGDNIGWGSIPAGLIEEITRGKVFKQDLSHFIKGVNGKIVVGRKSTRLRLNRRVEEFRGKKRFLGSKILIALDTSGSMSTEDLKKTFSVIESLKYKAELYICYCDTETTKPEKLRANSKRLNVKGRGGTNLRYRRRLFPGHAGRHAIS